MHLMKALAKNWHRADVVAAVHKRETTLAELARVNKRSEGALRQALTHPRTPSNRIIAAFLGLELHEIWPTWFDSQGRLRSRKSSRTRRRPSSQNRSTKLSLNGSRA